MSVAQAPQRLRNARIGMEEVLQAMPHAWMTRWQGQSDALSALLLASHRLGMSTRELSNLVGLSLPAIRERIAKARALEVKP